MPNTPRLRSRSGGFSASSRRHVDLDALVEGLIDELQASSTPERAAGSKQYLKSDLDFIGATMPALRKATRRLRRENPHLGRIEVLQLVEELWRRPVFEMRAAGVEVLVADVRLLGPVDMDLIERLLRESKTWALVDRLAAAVAGPLVERLPELGEVLDAWASDEDFWIRRSSMLALLNQLRAGGGDFDRFSRYADGMLEEKEFFIRKAIGWVLRDTSRKRPELVATWVGPRTHRMSGVTIREAVKNLPPEQKASFLTAYKEKRPAVLP